jgi:hypothetical protein
VIIRRKRNTDGNLHGELLLLQGGGKNKVLNTRYIVS